MSEEFDLFGNLVQPGRGCKGRPAFQPTDKDINKIKLLLALGWSNARIASAIDISAATLKRHFRATLKIRHEMRDRLDARLFEIAMEQANAGNVTAIREVSKMIERSDMMRVSKSFHGADREPEDKLGKKAEAADQAKTAGEGTAWQDDLKFDRKGMN